MQEIIIEERGNSLSSNCGSISRNIGKIKVSVSEILLDQPDTFNNKIMSKPLYGGNLK